MLNCHQVVTTNYFLQSGIRLSGHGSLSYGLSTLTRVYDRSDSSIHTYSILFESTELSVPPVVNYRN